MESRDLVPTNVKGAGTLEPLERRGIKRKTEGKKKGNASMAVVRKLLYRTNTATAYSTEAQIKLGAFEHCVVGPCPPFSH